MYVYIQAYNAEKTIRRAIDSILSQGYTYWRCLVCDNGSLDSTADIIREYAEKDSRIIPFYEPKNRRNIIYDIIMPFVMLRADIDKDLFCWLDSDDEYYSDFFEQTLRSIDEQNADIVAVGSDFYHVDQDRIVGQRLLKRAYMIEGRLFETLFPQYHQFTRTFWGKMYRLRVLAAMDAGKLGIILYGGDTIFVLETFLKSNRVYIMDSIHHRYYMNKKSVSYHLDEDRILSEDKLFDYTCEYLLNKCHSISETNMQFLLEVYYYGIEEILRMIMESENDNDSKLLQLHQLVACRKTRMLFYQGVAGPLLVKIVQWVQSNYFSKDSIYMNALAEIFTVLEFCPMILPGYNSKEILNLQLKIRERWFSEKGVKDIDNVISKTLSSSKYLTGVKIPFVSYFQEEIGALLNGDTQEGLDGLLSYINEAKDIPDVYWKQYIELLLNIAADSGDEPLFMELIRIKIQVLAESGEQDELSGLLVEWQDVFGEEDFFVEAKRRIGQ